MNDLSILRGPYIKKKSKQNMKIDIPLPCPSCGGKMYSVNYESSFTILKKEDGKSVRNVILKEIQMILRKQFAALEHKTCYF